jgi:large subunit ribosomal protein L24
MSHIRIKRGDRVVVTTGKEKGREGRVLLIDRKNERVIVEGLNLVHKHTKATQKYPKGGIVQKESPIHVSNVMLMHKGEPTRIGFKVERKEVDGKTVNIKYRIAKKTGEVID